MSSSPKPASAGGSGRKKRRVLAASQKYEVFVSTLTSAATQSELAAKYGVDRTTIRSICVTAKNGAITALAAARPGRVGKSPEQAQVAELQAEVERLRATIVEQAVKLNLIEGKDAWGAPRGACERGEVEGLSCLVVAAAR